MKYILEIGQLMPARQNYTYVRRAQAVTYILRWKQDSISESIEALKEKFYQIYGQDKVDGRIIQISGPVIWNT